ncbi:MAG: hypothetical protein JO122_06845 [Acetobacteraceae bacterium]|nr:hypothetical protein [Acetobacteraceae bacterium]
MSRLVPSWPLLVGLAALIRALAQPMALLNDPDTYLHIAAGRWMLAHTALPIHDPFSHTLSAAIWVPHEWLAEIVLAAVYRAAGWSGLVLLAAAAFAASLALLARFLLRYAEPFSTLIVVTLGAALVLGHLLVRPHILALPLLVLWSGALCAARDRGSPPPLRLLPVMALWANLHGSFMFGLTLALFLGAEAALSAGWRARQSRLWGVFIMLACASALITPNGLAGFLEPFRLMLMPALQASFGEWLSPNFQTFQPLEIWLLGIIALGFTTGVKLPITRLLLLLVLCHMALGHVRHAELVGLVGPLAIASALGPPIAAAIGSMPISALGRGAARLAMPAAAPATALVFGISLLISLPLLMRPLQRGDDPVTPAHALAAVAHLGITGPVFNSEGFGGYLAFRAIPTFIDGRAELYRNAFFDRYLAAERGDEQALSLLLDRYGVSWTLLMPQQGAVSRLDTLPGWQRIYTDDNAVIHLRLAAQIKD